MSEFNKNIYNHQKKNYLLLINKKKKSIVNNKYFNNKYMKKINKYKLLILIT